jgi:PKHD-type hydroxylase
MYNFISIVISIQVFFMSYITLPFQPNNHLGAVLPVKIFTPEECRQIIEIEGEEIPPEVYEKNNKNILGETTSYPKCKFIHYEKDYKWIFEKLIPVVNETNQKYFNFNISLIKDVQVLEFSGDAYFDWHMDIGKGNTSTRKLSLIIYLSDTDDYQGGVVQWLQSVSIPNEPGTMVFFPSFLPYKIWPVTSGRSYFMVAWADGPAFA